MKPSRLGTVAPSNRWSPRWLAPATGPAELIAQSVVELGDGSYQWTATPHTIDAAGSSLPADAPTFLPAGAGSPVELTGSDGVWARLAEGGGGISSGGLGTQVASLGATAASVTALTIGPGDATGTLTPGAGGHDVDALRDVVATGETFTVTATLPAFVLVADGAVDDGAGTALAAGTTAMMQGDIALTNTGREPAVVVPITIGLITTTTTTTVYDIFGDSDGDGLNNVFEVTVGTDPDNPDTDGDGVGDGAELDAGADPNNPDSYAFTTDDAGVREEGDWAVTPPMDFGDVLIGSAREREVWATNVSDHDKHGVIMSGNGVCTTCR